MSGLTGAPAWLVCPNTPPCGHSGLFHDIHEPDDPRPTCCIGACRCGRPPLTAVKAWPAESVATQVTDLLGATRALGPLDVPAPTYLAALVESTQWGPEYRVIPVDPLPALEAAVQAWQAWQQQRPRVVVSSTVPPGTMVVIEPHPDLPTVDQLTILLSPGDAHTIRGQHPLLALELGLL